MNIMPLSGPLGGPAPFLVPDESFTVAVSVAGAGANVVRAGVADRRWTITYIYLRSAGAVSVTFQSAGNNISGAIPLVPNDNIESGDGDHTVLRAVNVGESFSITLSGAVLVAGWVQMKETGQR